MLLWDDCICICSFSALDGPQSASLLTLLLTHGLAPAGAAAAESPDHSEDVPILLRISGVMSSAGSSGAESQTQTIQKKHPKHFCTICFWQVWSGHLQMLPAHMIVGFSLEVGGRVMGGCLRIHTKTAVRETSSEMELIQAQVTVAHLPPQQQHQLEWSVPTFHKELRRLKKNQVCI